MIFLQTLVSTCTLRLTENILSIFRRKAEHALLN